MAEMITFGETPLRFSPPANQRIEMAREARIYADGTASNVAAATAELGTDAIWISKLPETPLGRRVTTQLQEQGVETEITWTDDPDVRQGLVFREFAAPPREGQRWHDRSGTAAASAKPGDFPMERIRGSEIVFTGLGMAVLSNQAASTTEAVLRASNNSGAVTAADLDYQPGLADPKRYRKVLEAISDELDMLMATESAAQKVFDRNGSPRELANILSADYDLDITVITRSDHGAVALHDSPGSNVIHERETIETEVVDQTGQHAAFAGSFLQQLIEGADPARALSHAVATAALSRTLPGPFLTTSGREISRLVDRVIEASQ